MTHTTPIEYPVTKDPNEIEGQTEILLDNNNDDDNNDPTPIP